MLSKDKFVINSVPRSIASPESSGKIAGCRAQNMTKGMPIKAPDNTVMSLFKGAHLLVTISEPEENGALSASTGK